MKVVAVITSKFGQSYLGTSVSRIEDYIVDSALDTDADQFSITIGDTEGQLAALFKRDSEVRVSLAAAIRSNQLVPLLKGYADTIGLTHDGTLSIAGRDLSSAAIDDTALPYSWHLARPGQIIKQQAMERGISRFKIATMTSIKSLFTDGSESVWAFWYRMVRTKQMWIWVDSTGLLNIQHLNYGSRSTYFFGLPTKDRPNSNQWIKVMEYAIQKNTQTRVAKVWVFGDTGKESFPPVKIEDPKIADWIKKPLTIVTQDSAITSRARAIKEANETIFEGMVGELEIVIRISDPGWIVQQNKVCFLNLPKTGISGEFFIVGVRLIGGTEGFIQEVRLREKKYAVTQRIPSAPILQGDEINISPSALGSKLGIRWADAFVTAAQTWHGLWDFDLFLAGLIGIAEQESGGGTANISNTREGSTIEWSPPPGSFFGSGGPNIPPIHNRNIWDNPNPTGISSLQQWKLDFANEPGSPGNPFNREAGVGPMQLTDKGAKIKADQRFGDKLIVGSALSDEYVGGRWDAASNIWEGAEVLISKLNNLHLPVNEANFWLGIQAYNGAGTGAEAYMKRVRKSIMSKGGILASVDQALKNIHTLPAGSTYTGLNLGSGVPRDVRLILAYSLRAEGTSFRKDGTGAGGAAATGSGFYTSPMANGSIRRRTDNGVDFKGQAGGYAYAIGNAVVEFVNLSSTGFGNYIVYRLTDGPYVNRLVYTGHTQLLGEAHGDTLAKGDQIGLLVRANTLPGSNADEDWWAEVGFAKSDLSIEDSGNEFANFISQYMGIGGENTIVQSKVGSVADGYDCSGLAYAAYKSAGLADKIGGRLSTLDYWNSEKGSGDLFFVPQDQLLPGDLVFFADSGDNYPFAPTLMGIFKQDNIMITVKGPGQIVDEYSITDVGSFSCIGGMRVKNLWPITSTQTPIYGGLH